MKLGAMPTVASLLVGSPKLDRPNRRARQIVTQRGGNGGLRKLPTTLEKHIPKSKPGSPIWELGKRLTTTSWKNDSVDNPKREAKTKFKWM
jgi:hypothetical protein